VYLAFDSRILAQNRIRFYCSKQIITARDEPTEENLKALETCKQLSLAEKKKLGVDDTPYIKKSATALQGRLLN
jgi:hypothetical protein